MNLQLKKVAAIATIFTLISFSVHSQPLMPSCGYVLSSMLSLNGKWQFKYLPTTKTGTDSLFFQSSFNDKEWANIITPGNWELQGFAQPVYGKKLKEGTGLYRKTFTIPSDWKGKPVYIAFDGVQSGYSFWVNGKFAGSFASAFNRKTFDISAFVITGNVNNIAVKVITQPKGWEFDTNDDWSLSGIFRDVTVFSLPVVHIKDVVVKTFVKQKNASVDINAILENTAGVKFSKNLKLTGQLLDATGKTVKEFSISPDVKQNNPLALSFTQSVPVENAQLWSAENPYLYTLKLSLKDKSKEIQKYTDHVGIREISWNDGILKLNGMPIKLKGVNHHDLSPKYGRAITEPEMLQDLKLMREANINFIRLCHYPPQSRFLELCDSLGFYVMDEIAIGYGDELLTDTTYLPILKLRAIETLARDKNHPSVIIWSVGNENPLTDICLKTERFIRKYDTTRPYCFPQTPTVFSEMIKKMPDSLDLLDVHYPTLTDLAKYATMFKQPLVASEYAHALGLDFNAAEAYFEMMYAQPKLAGGAVWGFFDQGILRKSDKKIKKGESTLYAWATADSLYDTGGNQGTDGIVYANRVPQTDYWQMRKVYSPVKAFDDTLQYKSGKQLYKIRINNRFDFTNLSELTCKWQLMGDTTLLQSGLSTLDCLPHDTTEVTFQLTLPEMPLANFYYLKLCFEDKQKYSLYEKSYPISWSKNLSILHKIGSLTPSKPIKKDNVVTTGYYRFELKKDSCGVRLTNRNGEQIIAEGSFARVGRKLSVAQEATFGSKRSQTKHSLWSPFLLSSPVKKVKVFDEHQLTINYNYKPETPKERSLLGDVSYNFSDSGFIHINYCFKTDAKEEATETGLSFIIPSSYTEFCWVGKGPYAAYPGKDRLSEFGIYQLNNNDLYFAGNRQNVECAIFTNSNGNGFAIIANKANIAVERSEKGIIVSHNASVSQCFNKYEWPEDLFSFEKGKEIKGNFTLVPFTSVTFPAVLKELFGSSNKTSKAFQPFFHSYDQ